MTAPIQPFTASTWTVTAPLSLGGMHVGTRATIVALPSGKLALINPVPFDDETASAIDDLGEVSTIIAPNLFHHFYFNAACRRWPDARPLVPPELRRKKGDLVDHAIEMAPNGRIEDALFWHCIAGIPAVNERVFLVPQDEVLILTDLAFHFRDHPQWWLRTGMRILGAYDRFGPSRLLRSAIRDKRAFAQSLLPLLEYPFDKAIVAHGNLLESGAREAFLQAFDAYLSKLDATP